MLCERGKALYTYMNRYAEKYIYVYKTHFTIFVYTNKCLCDVATFGYTTNNII